MTRSQIMSKLQGEGMTPAAEKELKELLQVYLKADKAKTPRKAKQAEYRWNNHGRALMGVGLYWYQEYKRESC